MAVAASTLVALAGSGRNRSEARGNAAATVTGFRTGKTLLGLASLCADELALHDERRVCRNQGIQPLGAVAQIGRKDQTRLVAHVHLEQTQVKPSNNRAGAEAEAKRLTKISGHGRFKRVDGTVVDIGGSTGGFTRAVLYNWTPPSLDDEFQ